MYSPQKGNTLCLSYLEMFIQFSKIKFNSEFLIFSQKTLLRSFQTLWNCECVCLFFGKHKNYFKLFEIVGQIILTFIIFDIVIMVLI